MVNTKPRMGRHALGSLEIWDRMVNIIFHESTDIRMYICGGPEPEYTNIQKDFILGPRLEEGKSKFLIPFKGGKENFLSGLGGTDVFQHTFPISGAPPGGNK